MNETKEIGFFSYSAGLGAWIPLFKIHTFFRKKLMSKPNKRRKKKWEKDVPGIEGANPTVFHAIRVES